MIARMPVCLQAEEVSFHERHRTKGKYRDAPTNPFDFIGRNLKVYRERDGER